MRVLIVGAGLLLAPLLAWAGDATTDSGTMYPDQYRPPDATLAAACPRLELEGPGEYCVEWPWSKDDVLGCLQDPANPKPVDLALCTHLTSARDHCCKGWRGAGWRDVCRDSHTALWCRERKAKDPENPAWAKTEGGCAVGSSPAAVESAATVALVLLVAARRRRSRRSRVARTLLLLIALAASTARADVATLPPPPPCSRYQAEGPGEYCVEQPVIQTQDSFGCSRDPVNPPPPEPHACGASSDFAREVCCKGWLAAGWRFDCANWDNRGYALWCRKRLPGDPPRPELWQESGGCALGRSAAVGSIAGAMILALFVVVRLIRRRR